MWDIEHLQSNEQEIFAMRKNHIKKANELGPYDLCIMHGNHRESIFSGIVSKIFYFLFKGKISYPQNLSIYATELIQIYKSKYKINKSTIIQIVTFVIYQAFQQKSDFIIQFTIPGIMKIYKFQKKDLVTQQNLQNMYISSVLRYLAIGSLNWGRSYHMFTSTQDFFKACEIILKLSKNGYYIFISQQSRQNIKIKSNHALSLVFDFVKRKYLEHHLLAKIEEKNDFTIRGVIQLKIQLLIRLKQYKKCITYIDSIDQSSHYYLLFKQAQCLYHLEQYQNSIEILNLLTYLNEFQIWYLLSKCYFKISNFQTVLILLNNASKCIEEKNVIKREAMLIGKIKKLSKKAGLNYFPRLFENNIFITPQFKKVQLKEEIMLFNQKYDKLNRFNRKIFQSILSVIQCIDHEIFKKFVGSIFILQNITKPKFGFSNGYFQCFQNQSLTSSQKKSQSQQSQTKNFDHQRVQKLPFFMNQEFDITIYNQIEKRLRNLSVIQELQSIVDYSITYEKKQQLFKPQLQNHYLKTINPMFKQLIDMAYQIAIEHPDQYSYDIRKKKIEALKFYQTQRRKLYSIYMLKRMFKLLYQTLNYRLSLILVNQIQLELHQFVEQFQQMPDWIEDQIFKVINKIGIQEVNLILNKLKFYDKSIVFTLNKAKNWQIRGYDK